MRFSCRAETYTYSQFEPTLTLGVCARRNSFQFVDCVNDHLRFALSRLSVGIGLLVKCEEASTHKSAKTHAVSVFVTLES